MPPPDPHLDTTDSVGRSLDALGIRVSTAWRDVRYGTAINDLRRWVYETDDEPLEHAQARALEAVVNHAPCSLGQLAAALHLDPSSTSRAVDRLVRRDLVTRKRATDDRRAVVIEPTAEGARRHSAIMDRAASAMAEILAVFTISEREQLASQLERFLSSTAKFVESQTDDHR